MPREGGARATARSSRARTRRFLQVPHLIYTGDGAHVCARRKRDGTSPAPRDEHDACRCPLGHRDGRGRSRWSWRALYFAKDFLLPLALAALVGFMLNPLVQRLERGARAARARGRRDHRGARSRRSALIGWLLANEVTSLVASLPDFRANLVEKLRALRGPLRSLADALGWIDRLSKEIDPAGGARPGAEGRDRRVAERRSARSAASSRRSSMCSAPPASSPCSRSSSSCRATCPSAISALFALRGSRHLAARARRGGPARQRLPGAPGASSALLQGVVVTIGLALIGVPGALALRRRSRRCCARSRTSGRPPPRRCPSCSAWRPSPASRWRCGPRASSSASSSSPTTCSIRACWGRARACRRSVSSWRPRSGPGSGAPSACSSRSRSPPASPSWAATCRSSRSCRRCSRATWWCRPRRSSTSGSLARDDATKPPRSCATR